MNASPLLQRLRDETDCDHRALEAGLGLLAPPLSRARFVRALRGFHRFHRAWEPRIAELIGRPDLLAPRARLALIERDLQALGAAPDAAAAPPDLAGLSGPGQGWGSLYVMEGSTLGGMVIAKALREADWAPPGGLAYFDAHGRATAAMWRETCAALDAAAGLHPVAAMVEGARLTFATLRALAAERERE